jgi:hypothetical protein
MHTLSESLFLCGFIIVQQCQQLNQIVEHFKTVSGDFPSTKQNESPRTVTFNDKREAENVFDLYY